MIVHLVAILRHVVSMSTHKRTGVRRKSSIVSCLTMKRHHEPTAIFFLLKLTGIGIEEQTVFLSIVFILNLASLAISFVRVHGRSTFDVLNDIYVRLIISMSMMNILLKRNRVKSITRQLYLRLSYACLKRLRRLRMILSILFTLMWLIYLAIIVFRFTQRLPYQRNILLRTWKVNQYIFWSWTVIFEFILFPFNAVFYYLSIAVYTWSYVCLYYYKMEESRKFTSLVPYHRKTLLVRLIEMEEKHEYFESTFSLLLLFIASYLFGSVVSLIYNSGNSLNTGKTMVYALKTLFEVIAYGMMINLINNCQERLRVRSIGLQNFFYLDETLISAPSMSFTISKLISALESHVTVWGMVKVSRGLVMGTCSSIVTFSVLFVQIDNGSLKTA